MTVIEYTIRVMYPPNATEVDFREQLDELLDVTSRYGLGTDGCFKEVDENDL